MNHGDATGGLPGSNGKKLELVRSGGGNWERWLISILTH